MLKLCKTVAWVVSNAAILGRLLIVRVPALPLPAMADGVVLVPTSLAAIRERWRRTWDHH